MNAIKNTYLDVSHPYGYSSPQALYKYLKTIHNDIKLKDVKEFLHAQSSYTRHKQTHYHFNRRKTIVSKINHQWQIDLADLKSLSRHNQNAKYILFVIDVLSRKLYTRPLKNKKPSEVIKAFLSIMKTSNVKPFAIVSDQGSEFIAKPFQKMLQSNRIAFFPVYSKKKASIVERVQRTIKNKMFKYFTGRNTLKYIDILQDITKAYNNKTHGSIGMAPNQVTKNNVEQVKQKLYGVPQIGRRPTRPKFKQGDTVRIILNDMNIFTKSYLPHFSNEIYSIFEVNNTSPVTYKLINENQVILKRKYYNLELSKVVET